LACDVIAWERLPYNLDFDGGIANAARDAPRQCRDDRGLYAFTPFTARARASRRRETRAWIPRTSEDKRCAVMKLLQDA
jgi:hypothetical protein